MEGLGGTWASESSILGIRSCCEVQGSAEIEACRVTGLGL